jgi:hypothetical protein
VSIYVKNNKDFDEDEATKRERLIHGEEPTILSADLVAVERGRENFPYGYLPRRTQRLLREAFGCYTADLYLAFALLCRRTILVSADEAADSGPTAFERLFEDSAELSGIDVGTRTTLRTALFDQRADPGIDADQAAVLIEIVKDMFQQRYVRTAKLRRAIKVRRYFAHESNRNSPT